MSDEYELTGAGSSFWSSPTNTYASGNTWTEILGIFAIKMPTAKAKKVPTTKMKSPGKAETSQAGTIDYGVAEVTFQFNRTKTTAFLAAMLAPAGSWKCVYGDGSLTGFSGWIESIGDGELQRDETIKTKVTVQLTGPYTFVAGTESESSEDSVE